MILASLFSPERASIHRFQSVDSPALEMDVPVTRRTRDQHCRCEEHQQTAAPSDTVLRLMRLTFRIAGWERRSLGSERSLPAAITVGPWVIVTSITAGDMRTIAPHPVGMVAVNRSIMPSQIIGPRHDHDRRCAIFIVGRGGGG